MKSVVAARGAITTLGGQFLKYVVQMAALVILARLLTPEDYGLVAMVSAVVGIAMVIGDFGLGLSAVQATNLTPSQRNNLFWVNTLIGLMAGVAVFCSGSILADFYNEPQLVDIAGALSITFVINGLASQFRAELVRSLKFGSLATVDLTAQVISYGLAILGAMVGLGYWALVVQQVAFSVVTLLTLAAASRWIPGMPSRRAPMRDLYSFGASTFATQIINYVSSNADSVALGRSLGSSEVGIYNRAFQIFSLPLQQLAAPLTRVALPVLSRINDPCQYQRYVERMQLVLSYSLVGVLAFVASTSAPLLTVVLGAQWVSGSTILQILCLGGAFQALGYIYYWMFLSRAKMTTLLWCESIGRSVMIVLIVLAAPHGTSHVAAAVSCGLFVTWLMTTLFGLPRLGIDVRPLLYIALRPALIYAGMFTICTFIANATPISDLPPMLILISLTVACGAYLMLLCVILPVRKDFKLLFQTLSLAIKRP